MRAEPVASKPPGESSSRYYDAEFALSFAVPDGWVDVTSQYEEKKDLNTEILRAFGAANGVDDIVLYKLAVPVEHLSADAWVRMERDRGVDVRNVSQERLMINGRPALLICADASQGGLPLKTASLYFEHNRQTFILSLACLPQDYEENRVRFKQVVDSLRFDR